MPVPAVRLTGMHARYHRHIMTTGLERHPDRMPWKFLLPIFQNSNRQQVICSAQILQQAGLKIKRVN
jgi:hypothetical protein